MAIIDLRNCIIPTKLTNSKPDKNRKSSDFDTTDLVFLDSYNEILKIPEDERICYATDYAIMNGIEVVAGYPGTKGDHSCTTWLRSRDSDYKANVVRGYRHNFYGYFKSIYDNDAGIRPSLHLNLSSITSAKYRGFFKISEIETKDCGKCHIIEFGEYPKTYVGKEKNMELEELHSTQKLVKTGKKYTGRADAYGKIVLWSEYEYQGEKYVRVSSRQYSHDVHYSDGSKAEWSAYLWAKVEPIAWRIKNWDELPKTINPNGSEKAQYLDLKAHEAICVLPFYPESNYHEYVSMWQNSTIRGYLNGINVNNIKTNGNPNYTASNGGDFTKQNFLTEAFMIDDLQQSFNAQHSSTHTVQSNTPNKSAPKPQNTQQQQHHQQQQTFEETPRRKRPRKGYGVQVLDKPMGVNEQIKFYVEKGKSFMLHGASGIGKSRRIEEIDPEFVSIVLRNGILPEEVIGKTIYPNEEKTTTGVWVPPAWYTDLCAKCEREPDKNHVLFIDEITNVKPSEQSLVFHLVLNNSIGPNIGKLPPNVVIAAAGNSKEESEAAYNMPEPLFRRFDGHIELRPEIYSWLEWGSEQSKKGENRLKIHPIVSSFVATYSKKVFYSPYDSEEPPKYAIDPRGWEQVSDIIYDNNGLIVRELIENKVGKEIAASFVQFAKTPPLMIEDIIDKNYDQDDIPLAFDAKYALALSLRSASVEQVQQVRKFISKELGKEILSIYDPLWVGEDNERAMYISNLQMTNLEHN